MKVANQMTFVRRLKSLLAVLVLTGILSGCLSIPEKIISKGFEDAQVESLKLDKLAMIPAPVQQPVVAVYSGAFSDRTGQRKSNSEFALFSTAVTQGGEAYLIRALKHTSNGNFFRVVERVGIDHITKERQIIRSTRKDFKEKVQMQPLLFAGLLMRGGIISYDSNVKTGGTGARYLGISASKQYREDIVHISLRTVSVSTGEILIEVLVTKRLLSVGVSSDLFRFYEAGTELVEVEVGATVNESMAIALQKAVETAVYETIQEGKVKGFWAFQEE
ncbi:MAG: hypothetical protein CBB68_11130 [Rhodospirillaceae bacterium TMED8]|nr:MAG: hypothetical protein CBB68_11130 [Rhodospirillaceae bacterium TMED8]